MHGRYCCLSDASFCEIIMPFQFMPRSANDVCEFPVDLLLGRGGEVNNHIGNVYFRSLINEYKERYRAASRVDKV